MWNSAKHEQVRQIVDGMVGCCVEGKLNTLYQNGNLVSGWVLYHEQTMVEQQLNSVVEMLNLPIPTGVIWWKHVVFNGMSLTE